MQPLISIGMPVYNCEKTIHTAIKSILNQTYSNWELIVIDDGSKDKTLEIIKSFQDDRIKIITDGLNKQLPTRLNQAISLSSGKYFARMDGDDVSYPERLQTQVEYLEAHPEIDLLSTQVLVIDKNNKPQGTFPLSESHEEICSNPRSGFASTHPTWMGKTAWFRQHQYRPKAIRIEDQELLMRTYKESKFACLPDILLAYRIESFSLKKSLIGRYCFAKALLEQAFVKKDYLLSFGVIEQSTKALVDIFAKTSGLNFKLLKHRIGSLPVNKSDMVRWQEINSTL